jgi:hypothetical protein
MYTGGVLSIDFTSANNVITDTAWHHIALVKSASNYGIYLDGVQVAYLSDTSTATFAASLTVGLRNSPNYMNGYMEQVQITKGNKFGIVPATLNIKWDGADAATSYTAESGQTVTFAGAAQIDTAVTKVGTGSLMVNGASAYCSVPYSTDWDFGTGDFTCESWMYFNDATLYAQGMFVQADSFNDQWYVYLNAGGAAGSDALAEMYIVTFPVAGPATLSAKMGLGNIVSNQWMHFAWSRTNGVLKGFIDGVEQTVTFNIGTGAEDFGTHSAVLEIGGEPSITSSHYLDDTRIYKGYGKYTGNFTPSTLATDLVVPTAQLTQDTITVPTEQYEPVVVPGGKSQAVIIA